MSGGAIGAAASGAVSGAASSASMGSMLASTFLLAGSQALGLLTAPGPRRGTAAELAFNPGEASDVIPYVCGEVEVFPHLVTYFGYQNKKVPNDAAKEDILLNTGISGLAGYIAGGGTFGFTPTPPTAYLGLVVGGMSGGIVSGLGQLRTASYRHYCGFFYELCHGVIDGISAMKVDERLSFAGNDSNAGNTVLVDDPQAWGGDHVDGGTYWLVDIIPGYFWPTQQPNAHLLELLGGNVSSYNGKAGLVIHAPTTAFPESGYFAANPGAAPALRPFKVRVHKYPNNLGVPEYKKVNVSGNHADANIAECCYEWLTSPTFGVKKLSASRIDVDSFRLGAQTHFEDNLGVSLQFNTPTDVESALDTFTSIGDAIIWGGLRTGTIRYKVIKRDYSIPSLKVYRRGFDGSNPNEYNVIRIGGVSHGAWARTANNYTFRHKDRDNNFIDTARTTPDLANYMMQGRVRSIDQSLEGVSNGTQAAFIGTREMRAGSYPTDPITLVVNRDGFDEEPGNVIKLIDNVDDYIKIVRVAEIRPGTENTSEIEIIGTEDQYGVGASAYTPFIPTPFSDPVSTAVAASFSKVIEAPFFLTRQDEANLLVFAAKPNGAQLNFDTYVSTDGGTTYIQEGSRTDFAITGTITENIPRLSDPVLTSLTFTPANSFEATRLQSATETQIAGGSNIIYFDDTGEFMAVETVTDNGDGTYTLGDVWRAVHPFDSVPAPHSAGARVYFFAPYGKVISGSEYADATATKTKVLPRTVSSVLALASATAISHTIVERSFKPNPPRNVEINSDYLLESVPSGDITISWNETNRTTEGMIVKQDADGVDSEDSTVWELKIFGETGALIHTEAALASPTFTYTNAAEISDAGELQEQLNFFITTIRDGERAFLPYIRRVLRTSSESGVGCIVTVNGENVTHNGDLVFSTCPVTVNGLNVTVNGENVFA